MKKAAAMLMLVILMIGNGFTANVKPGDTATLQNGGQILNASEYVLEIGDYTDFGEVIVTHGDSLMMNGVWMKNYSGTPVAMRVELYSLGHIFQETVKLNKSRFDDVNLIQPGDSVFLSPRYVGGPNEVWIADSFQNLGKNDCIWRICERYRAGKLDTSPFVIELISAPIDKEINEATLAFNWWGWILLLLAFILLAGFIYWLVRRVLDEASRNPDNHPAVIEGGLSSDPVTATAQIQQHLPDGSRVVRLERGKLKRWYGPKRLLTNMNFSDRQRPAYIRPGEKVVRVTVEDQNGLLAVQYWRSHCGNRFSVFARDQFNLHAGWEFIVEVEYITQATESTSTAPENTETANAEAAAPVLAAPAATDNTAPVQNGHPVDPKKELSNFDKFLNLVPKDNIQELKFEDNAEFGMSVRVRFKN
ncbi:MAG: hypothetical protein Q8Q67_01650 [bacterium]|nr:hypothetical protein [bacterium]